MVQHDRTQADATQPTGETSAEEGTDAQAPNGAEQEPLAGLEEVQPAPDEEANALRAQLGEAQDRYMRALAEAENVRRRADQERRKAEQYGGARLARDLLPVFDNLTRALGAVTDEQREGAGAMIEGVELTLRELTSVLGRHGVEPIAPEVGDKFDPSLHDAMFEAPVPGTKAGDIIEVMAQGFMLHERLLRAAQVGVSSTPAS